MFLINPSYITSVITNAYNSLIRADLVDKDGTIYQADLIKRGTTANTLTVAVYIDQTSIPLGTEIHEVRLIQTGNVVFAKSTERITADSASGIFYTITMAIDARVYQA